MLAIQAPPGHVVQLSAEELREACTRIYEAGVAHGAADRLRALSLADIGKLLSDRTAVVRQAHAEAHGGVDVCDHCKGRAVGEAKAERAVCAYCSKVLCLHCIHTHPCEDQPL